ncbi:hypothetical protein FKM82_017845 [Ascaphus truei]
MRCFVQSVVHKPTSHNGGNSIYYEVAFRYLAKNRARRHMGFSAEKVHNSRSVYIECNFVLHVLSAS